MQSEELAQEPLSPHQALLSEAVGSRNRSPRTSTRLRFDTAAVLAKVDTSDERFDPVAPTRFGDTGAKELGSHLKSLAKGADLTHAEFLEALARFDELEGWRINGARDCVPETTGHRFAG